MPKKKKRGSRGKNRRNFKGFSYTKGRRVAYQRSTDTVFSNPAMYARILKEKGIKAIRTKEGKYLSVNSFFGLN